MPIGRSGSEFLVNSNRTSDQFQSSITTLADGRFAVVWRSGTTGTSDAIRMRIYNSDGTALSGDTLVASGKVDLPVITGLADGSIAVAWSVIDTASTSAVRFRLFSADGEAMTGGINVARSTTPTHATPIMTATADGFVVGTAESQILNSYGFEGEKLGGRTGDVAGQGALASFADGRHVVVSVVGTEVTYQVFGNGVTDTRHVLDQAAAGGSDSAPSVAVLLDQSLVIAWADASAGPQAQIIGQNGTVTLDIDNFARPPRIAALLDGRFILVWHGMNGGPAGEILAQIFNADGTASAMPFVVGDALTASDAAPSASVLADGKIVVTWRADDGDGVSGGLTNGADIRAQILDPTKFIGTTGIDVYQGGGLTDNINGNSGDDVFHGNGGNDLISGDGGDDQLFGDDGNDSLFGGAGADTLDGGKGDDQLSGGSGDDVLVGGLGTDRLLGGAGNDTIVVQELSNAAAPGGEFYDGGSGTGDVLSILGGFTDLRDDTLMGFEIIENHSDTLIFGGQMSGVTQLRGEGRFRIAMQDGQPVLDLSGMDTSAFDPAGTFEIFGTNSGQADLITGSDFGEVIVPMFGLDVIRAGGGNDTVILSGFDEFGKTLHGGDGADLIRVQGNEAFDVDFSGLTVTGFETIAVAAPASSSPFSITTASLRLDVDQIAGNGGDVSAINSFSGDSVRNSLLDLVMGSATSFNLSTSVTITGYQGVADRVTIIGDADSEAIVGSAGDEFIVGGGGFDFLIGLGGDDTYVISGTDVSVLEAVNGGIDTIRSVESRDLRDFANVEILVLTSESIVPVSGTGTNGADILDGSQGLGVANLVGLAGDDIYILGTGDTATETIAGAAGGIDTVKAHVSHTLGDNIENLIFVRNGGQVGTGNALDNVLDGSQASGAQTLAGLGGNDTYIVDGLDLVSETISGAAGGIDTVMSTFSIILGANVENLVLLGTSNIVGGTGNSFDNVLDGSQNTAANGLRGQLGNDTYVVDANDTIVELLDAGIDVVRTAFARTLAANVENLTLTGSAAVAGTGNELGNVLDGTENSAANLLTGLLGNDTYILGAGDIADETGGGAADLDLVKTAFSFSLSNAAQVIGSIENLTLTGSAAINGVGNGLGNLLSGNGANNVLQGLAGNDVLDGGAGVDTADYSEKTVAIAVTLTGATAATVKVGGINEDSLRNIENLLGGSAADTLVGDGLANFLAGNGGADKLTGGGGSDLLRGGEGTDTLDGGTGTDTADYSDKSAAVSVTLNGATVASVFIAGIKEDTVVNIENVIGGLGADTLIGDGLGNTLTGGKGNDTLTGNGGSDQLVGGLGRDLLTGGTGNDLFVFSTASDSGITASTQDLIADFTKGEDRIDLRGIDAMTVGNFTNDAFLSTLIQGTASTSFNGVQGQIIWFQVNNANDDLDRTIIRLNTDTDNTAEMNIELVGLHSLTAADFLL